MKWALTVTLAVFLPTAGVAGQEASVAAAGYGAASDADVSSPVPRPQAIRDGAVKSTIDMGAGYVFVRFASAPFIAHMGGLNLTGSYYVRDHLAVECSVTSTIGSQSSSSYDAKYLFIGGGVKRSVGNGRLQPFVHGLVGGVKVYPQTAFSNNGFAAQLGGGVERRLREQWWLRFEADYVASRLYHAGQNNFQAVVGIVYRFSPHR